MLALRMSSARDRVARAVVTAAVPVLLALFARGAFAAGKVTTWGGGQVPAPTTLSNVTAISVSVDHTVALLSDGTVVCWGNDYDGQCDVPAGLSGVTKVAAGEFFSIALKSDGTIVGWGADDYGQLEPPAGLTGVTSISAGHAHVLALKSNGTVVAWGSDAYGQTDVPTGLSSVKAVAAIWNYSLALKSDGTVVAWGVDDAGQTDVPAGLKNVASISGNETYAMAVGKDGSVTMWGAGPSAPSGLSGVKSVAAGENHALALKSDGSVVAWGTDRTGEATVPSTVVHASAVSAGWNYSAAILGAAGSSNPPPTGSPSLFQRGTYTGIFFDNNEVSEASSGSFTLTTTPKGTFTGSLSIGRTRYAFKGALDTNGVASVTIPARRNQPALTLNLQVFSTEQGSFATGTVSSDTWSATLTASRPAFDGRTNRASAAGRYTLVIPGTADSTNSPAGDGFGTLTVDPKGRIHFAGSLADGTKVTQSAMLSGDGEWPLYLPLYQGQGALVGLLDFAALPDSDLSGTLTWLKPAAARGSKTYPGGFTLQADAVGSAYQPPARGASFLDLTNAVVTLTGAGLPADIANQFSINGTRAKSTTARKASLSISAATGLFQGRAEGSDAGAKPVQFSGAVLEKAGMGSGFFLNAGQSGRVTLEPAQ